MLMIQFLGLKTLVSELLPKSYTVSSKYQVCPTKLKRKGLFSENSGKLETKVYQKKTDSDIYLH